MKKRSYVLFISFAVIAIMVLLVNFLVFKKRSAEGTLSRDAAKPSLSTLYDKAREAESKKRYLDARALYRRVLEESKDGELIQKAQEALTQLNMKLLFSPAITEESFLYAVKKGDTLGGIAKRFDTTVDLIMRSNGLQGDLIKAGDQLKISNARYTVVIDRSQNILTLKSNENVLRTYGVSTGVDNCTPLGTFRIINKLKNPVWYRAGAVVPSGSPENILGSRWMGLSAAGYGIHGTTQPESIGKHITAGCVRLREPEIQELYAILPIGTEITIVD